MAVDVAAPEAATARVPSPLLTRARGPSSPAKGRGFLSLVSSFCEELRTAEAEGRPVGAVVTSFRDEVWAAAARADSSLHTRVDPALDGSSSGKRSLDGSGYGRRLDGSGRGRLDGSGRGDGRARSLPADGSPGRIRDLDSVVDTPPPALRADRDRLRAQNVRLEHEVSALRSTLAGQGTRAGLSTQSSFERLRELFDSLRDSRRRSWLSLSRPASEVDLSSRDEDYSGCPPSPCWSSPHLRRAEAPRRAPEPWCCWGDGDDRDAIRVRYERRTF